MQRDGQNDTVHGSGDNQGKIDDLKLCTPRVKKVWQKTNNGNCITNTSRKISVQNSLLDSSDGTLVPDKTQTNDGNGIINNMRRPGTSSGDRHKNNGGSLFLPQSRSGTSSVVRLIKSKSARGSSHDKSETQTNDGNGIINPRVNTRRKVSVQVHDLLDSSSSTLVPKKRRRRKSNLALEKKYQNFKSLVKFVVKQTKERVNLLQLAMTPFKVCSSLIIRLEFVAYPPFIICNFVGPDTNGERCSM